MIIRFEVSWGELKSIKSDLGVNIYYSPTAGGYFAFVSCPIFYAEAKVTDSSDVTDFETNYQSTSVQSETKDGALAKSLSKRVGQGSIPVSIKARDEAGFFQWTIVSHDYTDKTTWYQKSTQTTNEILTGTQSNTVFTSANINWINPDSPKLYNQSYNQGVPPYGQISLRMPDGSLVAKSTFRPFIYVANVLQTSGYTIDYATGTVTFSSSIGGAVKATYYKATTSDFILTPPPGVIWSIPRVEVNTTSALIFNGTTYFQYWRDPSYSFTVSAYMMSEMLYQSFAQLQASATVGADIYPSMGGTGIMSPSAENGWGTGYSRGTGQESVIIPWEYRKPFIMKASVYDTIRLITTNDTNHAGADYLTATFYVEELPE